MSTEHRDLNSTEEWLPTKLHDYINCVVADVITIPAQSAGKK